MLAPELMWEKENWNVHLQDEGIVFTAGSVDQYIDCQIGRYSVRDSVDSRSTVGQ